MASYYEPSGANQHRSAGSRRKPKDKKANRGSSRGPNGSDTSRPANSSRGRRAGTSDGTGTVRVYYVDQALLAEAAVRQIEWYFNSANLVKDIFLRQHMDSCGYIPIAFVANFPQVARIGAEYADIVSGLLESQVVEVDVENETIRLAAGWETWLLPNEHGGMGAPRYIKLPTYAGVAAGSESPTKSAAAVAAAKAAAAAVPPLSAGSSPARRVATPPATAPEVPENVLHEDAQVPAAAAGMESEKCWDRPRSVNGSAAPLSA